MPESLRLAINSLRGKSVRTVLACLVVMMAVALVFSASGGMDCLEASFSHNLNRQLGDVTARVVPAFARAHQLLPFSVLAKLRAMADLRAVQGRATAHMPMKHGDHIAYANVVGIQMGPGRTVNRLTVPGGHSLTADPDGILLNGVEAAMLHATVGSMIMLDGRHAASFKLIGIIHRSPVRRFVTFPQAYIRLSQLLKLWPIHGLAQVDVLGAHGIKASMIASQIRRRLGPVAHVQAAGSARHAFSRMRRVIGTLRLGVSIPAAIGAGVLVLGLGLVGLAGRIRELGRLRCIGASTGQILVLVVFEQLVIAAIAIGGGIAIGLFAVWALTHHYPHFFSVFHISIVTLVLAVVVGGFAVVIGSLPPLVTAVRAQPMSAFLIGGRQNHPRRIYILAIVAAILWVLQVVLWIMPSPQWAVWFYLFFGVPMIILAACLACPAAVLMTERLCARPVAWLWGISRQFIAHNWVRSPYLAGAMAASLLAGMAFFVSMRSRGEGLLASWEFPAHFPDAFVFSPFQPISIKQVKAIPTHVKGVRLASALTAFWVHGMIKGRRVRLLFVAVEPKTFAPMLGLKYIGAPAATVEKAIESGQGIVISPQGARALHLSMQDRVVLGTIAGPKTVKVAGIGRSAGIDIAQNYLRVGQIFHKTAALAVLGTLHEAKAWFGVPGCNMVMLNVRKQAKAMQVIVAVKKFLSKSTAPSMLGSILGLGALQLHGTSVRQMKRHLNRFITDVMRALSAAAIGVMLVGAIGAAILIAAAIRQRRYEFGILRAVGATRWQILRLVIAQMSILVIVGIVIGAVLGIYIAFMATRVDHRMVGFDSRFVISWGSILWGALITAGLATALTAGPAMGASRAGIRALVSEGRG